ncbi:MAG: nucleoside hydrolase [Ardenticatenaceae bacterium]|nr:nucleoside hydrolase [Ardenticatenaceae bacterium]
MKGTRSTPRRIIIDTDPGVDDSMAILFAFCSAEVKIEGITTVFGNTGTAVTTANALRLVELAGHPEVPVARGAEKPLMRPFTGEGWRVHGRNGLGEVQFPEPQGTPDPRRAAQFIADMVMANPGEMTLVPLAPLTNIALAVSLEPRITENVREVVLMGGAANRLGNASPVAEANIRNDPEAAHIVFHAGWPITMVGLDVTRKTVMTPAYLETLCSAHNRFTDFICAIVPHYLNFYRATLGLEGFHVHDSSALAYVIDPSLFETKVAYVDVEYVSPFHAGLTVADWRGQRGREPNVNVCVDVDSERFLALYRQRLMEARV